MASAMDGLAAWKDIEIVPSIDIDADSMQRCSHLIAISCDGRRN